MAEEIKGLRDFVAQDLAGENKEGATLTPPAGETPPGKPDIPPGEGKTAPFKTPEEAFRAYQEIQGFATRVTQENKTLSEQLTQLKEQLDLLKYQQPVLSSQAAQPAGTGDFDSSFIANPERAIEDVAEKLVAKREILSVLSAEKDKNQAEFLERYDYAKRIVQAYPMLGKTAAGIRKAFETGDRMRQDTMKKNAERAFKLTFGDDADIEKFKALIKAEKTNNPNLAYMPDTGFSSSSRPRTVPGPDAKIEEAVKKGDYDTVIAATFANILKDTG